MHAKDVEEETSRPKSGQGPVPVFIVFMLAALEPCRVLSRSF